MLTGTNLKYTKAHNVRIVVETIRLFGPISRKQIIDRTTLAPQTVSNITRELLDGQLILEVDRLQEGRGAPTALFQLNPDGGYSIGLDLDREHFTAVLVDFLGNVRNRLSVAVRFPKPDEAIELMVEATKKLIAQHDNDKIWGVGVGLPGPLQISDNSAVSNVVNPAAFPGWTNVPVVDLLSDRLNLPVYIENNATSAAVGERWYGKGRHIKDFFYLFFGVGLGGGLLIDGRPYEGHNGNAGEIGAIPTEARQQKATGLTHRTLGSFFSLLVLSELLGKTGIEISKPEDLGELFEKKQPLFLDWLDEGVAELARFILSIECTLDPEAIFLGGRYPEPLLRHIKTCLDKKLPGLRLEEKMAHPKLMCATAGEDSTALGVATLPMYNAFAPLPEVLMKHAGTDASLTSLT